MKKIHLFVPRVPKNVGDDSTIGFLEEAAAKRGVALEYFDLSQCKLLFQPKPTVLLNGKKPRFKKLLVRVSSFENFVELQSSVIRQFEYMGVRTVNSYSAAVLAKNKIRQTQALAKHKIPMPKTVALHSSLFLEESMDSIGRYPVIVKSSVGLKGIGVMMVESKRGLRSLVDAMSHDDNGYKGPLIVQEYIKESSGKDIRVFVVGGKIIAAMERIATKKGEFRSNFSIGGRVRIASLSSEEKKLAIKAAKAIGLDIAGVDIIRSKNGPMVLEVNTNPGLKGITEATGIDVAGSIIDYYLSL